MKYYSERTGYETARDKEELSDVAVKGIGALIRGRASSDAFAQSFPVTCQRCAGRGVTHGDTESFWDALAAVVPGLGGWPRRRTLPDASQLESPLTPYVFDAIEFCWQHIADVQRHSLNSSIFRSLHILEELLSQQENRDHVHLRFHKTIGQENFRNELETILRRNGNSHSLTKSGRVERILPPEFDAIGQDSEFHTGDEELNRLLDTARTKFLNPRLELRREALEALWDAWERLKTIWPGCHKGVQADAMLDEIAGVDSPMFREAIGKEATALNGIGNNLRIRHSETTQEILVASEHMDYLFQRMFGLIWMILRSQKMVGAER